MEEIAATAQRYLAFAENEAAGNAPLYVELARGIARDETMLAFLASLPTAKRQPNLFLAAVKFLCGAQPNFAAFRSAFMQHTEEIRSAMLARSTQTNEAARSATFMPLLSMLPQPIALIEVGASAGLCLLPDFYRYDYDGARVSGTRAEADAPTLSCALGPATPPPDSPVDIAWRTGLDLNPIDATDEDSVRWLEALVWPGQEVRTGTLQAALQIAARERPRIVQADLRTGLPALLREAPAGATPVVIHTAVLSYVPALEDRAAFARLLQTLGVTWIANEWPGVFPQMSERAPKPWPQYAFLQSLNGRPLSRVHPHGASLDWFTEPDFSWPERHA